MLHRYAYWCMQSVLFSYRCLLQPPPLLGGAISKPLTLFSALAFQTSNVETVTMPCKLVNPKFEVLARHTKDSSMAERNCSRFSKSTMRVRMAAGRLLMTRVITCVYYNTFASRQSSPRIWNRFLKKTEMAK